MRSLARLRLSHERRFLSACTLPWRQPAEMRALLRQVGQHTAVTTAAQLKTLCYKKLQHNGHKDEAQRGNEQRRAGTLCPPVVLKLIVGA